MKKMVCAFFCVILVVLQISVMAETSQFDWYVFQDVDGYTYDKFDKAWNITNIFNTEKGFITLKLQGAENNVYIVFGIADAKNSIGEPKKIQLLLDGEVYELRVANVQSSILGLIGLSGEKGRKFCVALSQAKEVSYKITGEIGVITEDLEGEYAIQFKNTIQDCAAKIIISRAFNYARPGLENFGITNDDIYITLPNE